MNQLKITEISSSSNNNHALISDENHSLSSFEVITTGGPTTLFFGRIKNGPRSLILKMNTSRTTLDGEIGLTREHMLYLGLGEGSKINLEPLPEGHLEPLNASEIIFKCYRLEFEQNRCASSIEPEFLDDGLDDQLKNAFMNQVVNKYLKIRFQSVMVVVADIFYTESNNPSPFGRIWEQTKVKVEKYAKDEIFQPGIDPNELGGELTRLGIGGMQNMFNNLVNTLFKSKALANKIINDLRLQPIKGVMLYGPPGTGKTLIARNFCRIIQCVIPQVVNGSEVFDTLSGSSEKNVRNLFQAAHDNFEKFGDSSPLHVIIFDEFDSVARARGGSHSENSDKVVNQLLTMIDGVRQVSNVLIIASTNQIDLIDKALLRPGRIEVLILVDFPSDDERRDIINLKIKPYMNLNLVIDTLDVSQLVTWTSGMSGADISSMVSRTFNKLLNDRRFEEIRAWKEIPADTICMTTSDFIETLSGMTTTMTAEKTSEKMKGKMPMNDVKEKKKYPAILKQLRIGSSKTK